MGKTKKDISLIAEDHTSVKKSKLKPKKKKNELKLEKVINKSLKNVKEKLKTKGIPINDLENVKDNLHQEKLLNRKEKSVSRSVVDSGQENRNADSKKKSKNSNKAKPMKTGDEKNNASEFKKIKIKNSDSTKDKLKVSKEQKDADKRTIFIGNLPSNTKMIQLKKLLSPYGNMVKCRFRMSNGKKIFNNTKLQDIPNIISFAVMENVEGADQALILNGSEFKGHHIRVTKVAKNYEPNTSKSTIFIGNLKYSANDEKLYGIFSSCGEIDYVRTINNQKGCKGCAYVCFKKPDSVGLALELNKTLLDDRPIHVERYSTKKLSEKKGKSKQKVLTGFERRMMSKMSKSLGGKNQMMGDDRPRSTFKKPMKNFKKNAGDENISGFKKKKTEFKGVKVDKKKLKKPLKSKNPLQTLANKIAPKG